jgi:hypothetical protein
LLFACRLLAWLQAVCLLPTLEKYANQSWKPLLDKYIPFVPLDALYVTLIVTSGQGQRSKAPVDATLNDITNPCS